MLILGLLLSLGVGLSLGLLGGGGSILTVPILVYVLGLDAKPAIATSLLVVGVTSAAAMVPHARAGRVRYRVGLGFGASSMAGAFAGGRVAPLLPADLLLGAFAVMMLVTGLAMLRGRAARAASEAPPSWARVSAIGVAIGVLTGVIGAGGGFVIVPALALLCGLPITSAVATSLLVITVNSLAGLAGYAGQVPIDLHVAGLVVASAVAGSVLGASLAGRVSPESLRRAFAWLVLAMSVFMIGKQVSPAAAAGALVAAVAGALVVTRRARVRRGACASPTLAEGAVSLSARSR